MELTAEMLAVLLSCLAASVQSVVDDDYPNVEVPGFAVPHLDESEDVDADPAPCCLPKEYQTNVTVQSGSSGRPRRQGPKFIVKSTKVFVNENTGKVAVLSDVVGRNRSATVGAIVVFGANDTAIVYVFDLNAGKCWKKNLNGAKFQPQCLPPNSTYEGETSLGPISGGLKVQKWRFCAKSPSGRRGGQFFVAGRLMAVPTATAGICIPAIVQERVFIRRGPSPHANQYENNAIVFEQSEESSSEEIEEDEEPNRRPRPGRRGRNKSLSVFVTYTDFKPSIDDQKVFTPPSYCNVTAVAYNPNAPLAYDEEPIPDILDRFILY